MIRRFIYTLAIALTCVQMEAQVNLVPNPSFELLDSCNTNGYLFNVAVGWSSANSASPDVFNLCSSSISSGVPLNNYGFQFPSHGDSYAGIFTYRDTAVTLNEWREYMQIELISQLVANVDYSVRLDISLSDSSDFACFNFGVYFSDTSTFIQGFSTIILNPQVQNTNLTLDNYTSWTTLSGTFTATGVEKYILIGNFTPDSLSMAYPANTPGLGFTGSYYYVDNIIVTPITSINSATSNELGISSVVINDKLSFEYKGAPITVDIVLYSIDSRRIVKTRQYITEGRNQIQVPNIAEGIYILSVTSRKKVYRKMLFKR